MEFGPRLENARRIETQANVIGTSTQSLRIIRSCTCSVRQHGLTCEDADTEDIETGVCLLRLAV